MVEATREKLLHLWQHRKRLIVLLSVVGMMCLLATVTPQVSARPDPEVPLEETVPPVGGTTLPYAWLTALAPFIAVAAVALAAAGVVVVWRYRQK